MPDITKEELIEKIKRYDVWTTPQFFTFYYDTNESPRRLMVDTANWDALEVPSDYVELCAEKIYRLKGSVNG